MAIYMVIAFKYKVQLNKVKAGCQIEYLLDIGYFYKVGTPFQVTETLVVWGTVSSHKDY